MLWQNCMRMQEVECTRGCLLSLSHSTNRLLVFMMIYCLLQAFLQSRKESTWYSSQRIAMCSVQSRVCISVTQCSTCRTISHFSFNGFLVLQSPRCLIYALILISVVLIINAERCLSKCISAFSHHRCLALGQSLRGN